MTLEDFLVHTGKICKTTIITFNCSSCGEPSSRQFRSFTKENLLCRSCNTKSEKVLSKYKKTNLEKYGKEFPIVKENKHLGRRYHYKGHTFHNKWEFAFFVFHEDNGFFIKPKRKKFKYSDTKYIQTSFLLEGNLIYLQGGENKLIQDYLQKEDCYQKHNIKVLRHHEIIPFLDWVTENKGEYWMQSFKDVN